jgi:hypothetical protein
VAPSRPNGGDVADVGQNHRHEHGRCNALGKSNGNEVVDVVGPKEEECDKAVGQQPENDKRFASLAVREATEQG